MEFSRLKQITPFSKALAAALFILMPFLGVYIGYKYAPEKVVYIETEVIEQVAPSDDDYLESLATSTPTLDTEVEDHSEIEEESYLIDSQFGKRLIFDRDHENSYVFEYLIKERVNPENPIDPYAMFVTKLNDRYTLVDASYNPAGMTDHFLVDEIEGVIVGSIDEFDAGYGDQNIFRNPNLLAVVEDSQGKRRVVQLIIDNAASETGQSVYLQDFVTSQKILLREESYSNNLSLGVCEYGCFLDERSSLSFETNSIVITRFEISDQNDGRSYTTYQPFDEVAVDLPADYKLISSVEDYSCRRSSGSCVSE